MSQLKIGDLAPTFVLSNQQGESVSLAQYRGKKNVLVYFYPKASTPGCTTQACGIRDYKAEFDALNTKVLAISPDEVKAIARFVEKQGLNFNLLSDPDHATAEAYGVWGMKKFMGREFMGIIRSSFIVDLEGRLVFVSDKVNTKTHHDDMLEILRNNTK